MRTQREQAALSAKIAARTSEEVRRVAEAQIRVADDRRRPTTPPPPRRRHTHEAPEADYENQVRIASRNSNRRSLDADELEWLPSEVDLRRQSSPRAVDGRAIEPIMEPYAEANHTFEVIPVLMRPTPLVYCHPSRNGEADPQLLGAFQEKGRAHKSALARANSIGSDWARRSVFTLLASQDADSGHMIFVLPLEEPPDERGTWATLEELTPEVRVPAALAMHAVLTLVAPFPFDEERGGGQSLEGRVPALWREAQISNLSNAEASGKRKAQLLQAAHAPAGIALQRMKLAADCSRTANEMFKVARCTAARAFRYRGQAGLLA